VVVLDLRVSEYMSSPVITARMTDNLAYVRNLMLKHGISRVVIVDESLKPISIITKGDMIRVMISKEWRDRPLESIYVSDVRGPVELKLATPRMTVKRVAKMMIRNLISGLPVVSPSSGDLLGIITKTDLLEAYVDGYGGAYKVGDLMTKNPHNGQEDPHNLQGPRAPGQVQHLQGRGGRRRQASGHHNRDRRGLQQAGQVIDG